MPGRRRLTWSIYGSGANLSIEITKFNEYNSGPRHDTGTCSLFAVPHQCIQLPATVLGAEVQH